MRNKKSEERKEYDFATREEVWERDKGRCVLCHKPAHDVHEIVPRSAFGYDKSELLFSVKNRVCLCRDCHNLAHSYDQRRELILTMRMTYSYQYTEKEFEKYL